MVVEEKELDEEIKKEVDSEEGDSEEEILEESNPESTEPEVEASEEDTTSEADTTKKKSFFGREKKEKPNKLQEKVDELEDRVKRQMAEFENFRKRSEKEKSAMFETGAKSVSSII